MKKILTFKKRKDFLRVAKQYYIATHNVVVQAAHSLSDDENIYVGYTATKKIGNAVVRCKAKRRLRAIVREILFENAAKNIDYIFIARNSTAFCNYSELKKDTIFALKKLNKNFTNTNQTPKNDQNEKPIQTNKTTD